MKKNIFKHIALTLKKLRDEKGWSLDKTAEKTGVSKAMLGQIEREESSPTIATLWKIARGFDISFSSFIEDVDFKKSLQRRKKAQLHSTSEKMKVLSLFPFDKQLNFEIFIIELLPECEHLSPAHQAGVIEHVIVVDGSMEVFSEGKWRKLNKGEGIRFEASEPHGYRNLTSEIAIFHNIIHYIK